MFLGQAAVKNLGWEEAKKGAQEAWRLFVVVSGHWCLWLSAVGPGPLHKEGKARKLLLQTAAQLNI